MQHVYVHFKNTRTFEQRWYLITKLRRGAGWGGIFLFLLFSSEFSVSLGIMRLFLQKDSIT